ncbi:MAG: transcription termination factor NusA, partial [Candidatus Omnitrophica bacterium]|nr:transcription termination factor NusA [Candidatus Omnitrophota bacterium]
TIDPKTCNITAYETKIIVDKVSDKDMEISKSDVKKLFSDKAGAESVDLPLAVQDFGRIAAQTAKQVIIQRFREAERDVIYEDFQAKVGNIVTGAVHRFERGDIIVDLGKTEGVLPRHQQCPHERYKQGERLRAFILEVNKNQKGPSVILSRANPNFVKKLFELEVPEILEGIVEIRSISREPGERTKIAVSSKDEKVDSVGACVGVRGQRVKAIVSELHEERIDIVRYSDDIKEYAKASLSPAEIASVAVNREGKRLAVVVEDDQLSLAIGKRGQNVRLASKLVGWEMDVRSKSQLVEQKEKPKDVIEAAVEEAKAEAVKAEAASDIEQLEGVGKKTKGILIKAGLDTVSKIQSASAEDLAALDGIGKKTAEKIIKSAKEIGQ